MYNTAPVAAPKLKEEPNVSPLPVSISPSVLLERAKSESIDLLNQSTRQLSEAMKSVDVTKLDGIKSLCQLTSEVHKLIRLKFDIARYSMPQTSG